MNNIIRTTIEAMAAVLGGTQSLHTNSYDEAVGLPTTQTARVARNTQLIMQEETRICDVADPWGGSYMMESLTDEIEAKALEIIREVESMGGMIGYINSGTAKLRIEESATKKQARIDSGQEVVVGVNKYRLEHEESMDVLQIDNTKVRAKQVARLDEMRRTRDEAAAQNVLRRLEASARLDRSTSKGNDPDNLLQLCVEAAKARCSLGEMSLALEKAWGRHVPQSSVVQGAYSASFTTKSKAGGGDSDGLLKEFESVLERVRGFETREGRRPRILVAKMGQDGHDRGKCRPDVGYETRSKGNSPSFSNDIGAKVIASGFSDLGFDVDIGPLFQTPEEVALQALDSDVHVIGISSQAAGHRTLLPALKKELDAKGASHIVVVAGGVIPPVDYDYLMKETKSCSAVFGPGTRVTACAAKTLDLIEERLPELTAQA